MKRYDVGYKDDFGFFCCGYGKEDTDGEWVCHEDAASLQQQLAEARAALRDCGLDSVRRMNAEWYVTHAAALKAARGEK